MVFLFSFFESLAFIGFLIPGATAVVVFGFLSSQGYLHLGDLIWFAAFGAVLGDGISYYLGTKGTRFFKHENRLLKISHLETAQEFFKKHGNKSIFLGRFVGPLRAIVPFVAGLSKMNIKIFLFWNILSGFVWAIVHLLLGYFFGGALGAIEAWTGRLSIFLGGLTLLLFVIWFLTKKGHLFLNFVKSVSRSIGGAIARNPDVHKLFITYPRFFRFIRERVGRDNFSGLPLTVFGIASLYVFLLFVGLTQDVLSADPIVAADIRLANLFYVFRDTELIKFFLFVTVLGKIQIVLFFALISSVIFWLWKKRIYIATLWLTLSGTLLFVFMGKLLVHRARPSGLIPYYHESSLSFPSGHSAMAMALYGFFVYFLWRQLGKWKYKTTVLFIGSALIVLIGLSRMYLGVHFLSDVLGGYLIGLLWLIIGITLTEWYVHQEKKVATYASSKKIKFISAFFIGIGLVFYIIYAAHYKPPLNTYEQSTTIETGISPVDIFSGNLSKSSEGLLGNPQEPFNFIIIAKNPEELMSIFADAGWYVADEPDITSLARTVKAAILKQPYENAPVTPSFWNATVHDFAFEKPTELNTVRQRHHIRIWQTHIQTLDGKFIYIGTASFDNGLKWFVTHNISPDIDTEREFLFTDLNKTGLLLHVEKIQFVDPVLGKNSAGEQFFTDGKAYLLYLK